MDLQLDDRSAARGRHDRDVAFGPFMFPYVNYVVYWAVRERRSLDAQAGHQCIHLFQILWDDVESDVLSRRNGQQRLQKTPRFAEADLPKGRDEGPRGQLARLQLQSVPAVLAAFVLLVHFEEGAQPGSVRQYDNPLSSMFADPLSMSLRSKNMDAEIRQRPPDEWVL